MNEQAACGILFHQRPMLQDLTDVTHPMGALFFMSWLMAPEEEITDESLASATAPLSGQNILFLKALIDGNPEIINVELPQGELLRAEQLRAAQPVICVHYTNDPASGFYCRNVREVKILAPIRGWKLRPGSGDVHEQSEGAADPAKREGTT